MRIEYLEAGAVDCPLVLIHGNEPESIQVLQDAIQALVEGTAKQLAIHELPGFLPVDNCQLYAWVEAVDYGVLQAKSGGPVFVCSLCRDSWQAAIGLLEPFADISRDDPKYPNGSYQYLTNAGKINLIISTDPGW